MELLGDVSHVESRFVRLDTMLVLVQDRCMVYVKRTIVLEIIFGRTRWYAWVMRLMSKLISVYLEIVLILTQDGHTRWTPR